MVKKRKSISLITSTVMAASIFNFSTFIPVQAASDAVFTSDRISGADRFETAAKIADKGWTTTSDYAIIATGENYPDALCASPLAKKYNAPIILTETNILSDSAQKELKKLSVKNVIIVGGTGAVSSDVENQIKSLGITVTRIAGGDRYETSLKIAKQLDKPSAISITTGNDFADALSVASIAAMKGEPILLINYNFINDGIKQYINDNSSTITNSYVIGGTGVVSDSVLNSLKNPIRLSGNNRYETNTAVLNYFKNDLDLSNIYLATGNDFPDALSASALASNTKTPIILVSSRLGDSTISYLRDNKNLIKNITAVGGTGVISDNLVTKFQNPSNIVLTSEWKEIYREKIKENIKDYGCFIGLIDIDLDGTPELLIGGIPGSGGFANVDYAYTIKNGSLVNILNQSGNNFINICSIYTSKLYYNPTSKTYQIFSKDGVRGGYNNYYCGIAKYSLINNIVSQTDLLGYVYNDGNITYYGPSGAIISKEEYDKENDNLYNGWNEIPGFGTASENVYSASDIDKILDSYSSINVY